MPSLPSPSLPSLRAMPFLSSGGIKQEANGPASRGIRRGRKHWAPRGRRNLQKLPLLRFEVHQTSGRLPVPDALHKWFVLPPLPPLLRSTRPSICAHSHQQSLRHNSRHTALLSLGQLRKPLAVSRCSQALARLFAPRCPRAQAGLTPRNPPSRHQDGSPADAKPCDLSDLTRRSLTIHGIHHAPHMSEILR